MTTEYKAKKKCAKCGVKIEFYGAYTINYNRPRTKYSGKPLCEKCSKEETQ